MKARFSCLFFIIVLGFYLGPQPVDAQETAAPATPAAPAALTVPDLTGMNIPQAAAALNRVGVALGKETAMTWTQEMTTPVNTVSQQSIAPGTPATAGSSVDVMVLRAPNVTLIYDDNDLTFINQADRRIDFNEIAFHTLQSTTPASFQAARWAGRVSAGACTQLWSINRGAAKDVAGCSQIERWLTTNNRAEHFWTTANGVQTFNVVQGGVERAICEAAPPGSEAQPKTCTLYLEAAGSSQDAGFVYFAYTRNQFLIVNSTSDKWMRLNRSLLYIRNPADGVGVTSFDLGDANTFGNPQIVARIQRLAPGQCLLYTRRGTQDPELPQPCTVIAQRTFEERVFWDYDFELQSVDDGKRRVCTAAVADKLTICIMPR
jgi:hypothetical protein